MPSRFQFFCKKSLPTALDSDIHALPIHSSLALNAALVFLPKTRLFSLFMEEEKQ